MISRDMDILTSRKRVCEKRTSCFLVDEFMGVLFLFFSFFSFFFLDDDLHLNGRNCSLTDFSGNVYVKKNLKFLNCDQLSDISGNITVGKSLTCRRCSSLTDISGKINAGSQVHFGYCPRKGKKKGMCTLVDIFRGYILDTLIFTTNVYLPYFFYL